eukprot:GCRY01001056.1.p1 GENE.GCRY01001056.1~~GCRY01001056.1.p1  ORF type:complete len:396 (-),score=34.71 GCRY01001056.1:918-2105(-)
MTIESIKLNLPSAAPGDSNVSMMSSTRSRLSDENLVTNSRDLEVEHEIDARNIKHNFFNEFMDFSLEREFRLWHFDKIRNSVVKILFFSFVVSFVGALVIVPSIGEKYWGFLSQTIATVILGGNAVLYRNVQIGLRYGQLLSGIAPCAYFLFATMMNNALNGTLGEPTLIRYGVVVLLLASPSLMLQCHFKASFFCIWFIVFVFGVGLHIGNADGIWIEESYGILTFLIVISSGFCYGFKTMDSTRRSEFLGSRSLSLKNKALEKRLSTIELVSQGKINVDSEVRSYLMANYSRKKTSYSIKTPRGTHAGGVNGLGVPALTGRRASTAMGAGSTPTDLPRPNTKDSVRKLGQSGKLKETVNYHVIFYEVCCDHCEVMILIVFHICSPICVLAIFV